MIKPLETLHKLDRHDLKQLIAFWEAELAMPCLECDKRVIAEKLMRLNEELGKAPL